jgi:hypothetical protein
MSGGHWEYKQYEFQRMADDVDAMVITNDDRFTEETLLKFKNAANYMRIAFVFANAIDMLVCGDYNEKSFHEVVDYQIKEHVEAFRRKLRGE